jgi:hypothetical protein
VSFIRSIAMLSQSDVVVIDDAELAEVGGGIDVNGY